MFVHNTIALNQWSHIRAEIRRYLLEKYIELKKLEYDLTVCKVETIVDIDITADFFFIGKTDEERSLTGKGS